MSELLNGDWCASLRAEEALVRAGSAVLPGLLDRLSQTSAPPAAILRVMVRIGKPAADAVCNALAGGRLEPSLDLVRALCEIGDPASATEYLRLASHYNGEIRRAAATGLAVLGDGVLPTLYEAATDENALVRAAVLPLLAKRGAPEALRALKRGLADPSADVRKAAANACLLSGEDQLVDAVCRTLADSELEVRVDAAAALLAGMSALPETVIRVLKTLESPQQREAVAEALSDHRQLDGALDYILENASLIRASTLLTRKLTDPRLRGRALEGLRRLANYPIDPLIDLLSCELPEVRAYAVELLILAGERAVPDLIRRGLESYRTARTRFEAKAALAGIGDAAAVALVEKYPHFSTGLQTEVVVLLGRTGSAKAVPLLANALEDDRTAARAAGSLGQIAQRTGDPVLRQAIPELRRRSRPWRGDVEAFRVALAAIEAATKEHAALPLAARAASDTVDLPVPAQPKPDLINLPRVPAADPD